MQKLFYEVRRLDKRCCEEFGLSEDILMENASQALCESIKNNSKETDKIVILCGPGNNGADGITSARILQGERDVALYLPLGAKASTAKQQLKRAKSLHVKIIDTLEEADIYVDALFGSGLDRELSSEIVELLKEVNDKDAIKIACDIPTGIDADGVIKQVAFNADITVTMGALKEALYSDSAKDFVGEIKVANLGISRVNFEGQSSTYLLEQSDLKLPYRQKKSTHKGDFGHTCVLTGKKSGAGILCGSAAFNFGSGLVTLIAKELKDAPEYLMQAGHLPDNCSVVAAGMGLGGMEDELLFEYLLSHPKPLVIDADLFYEEIIIDILEKKDNIVLTPHPKEFCALLKVLGLAELSVHEVQQNRMKYVKLFSQKYPDVVLVLKGANTIITQNKKIYINPLGTNKLSKGGSGDVLAGMIASLIAQKYSLLDATVSASLAHALVAKNSKCASYALSPVDLCEGIKWL